MLDEYRVALRDSVREIILIRGTLQRVGVNASLYNDERKTELETVRALHDETIYDACMYLEQRMMLLRAGAEYQRNFIYWEQADQICVDATTHIEPVKNVKGAFGRLVLREVWAPHTMMHMPDRNIVREAELGARRKNVMKWKESKRDMRVYYYVGVIDAVVRNK